MGWMVCQHHCVTHTKMLQRIMTLPFYNRRFSEFDWMGEKEINRCSAKTERCGSVIVAASLRLNVSLAFCTFVLRKYIAKITIPAVLFDDHQTSSALQSIAHAIFGKLDESQCLLALECWCWCAVSCLISITHTLTNTHTHAQRWREQCQETDNQTKFFK